MRTTDMTDTEVIEYLKYLEKKKAEVEAGQARAMARLAELRGASSYVADEIAAEMTWTPRHAANRLHDALALVERLPNTLDALAHGDLNYFKTSLIVQHTDVLTDLDQVKQVEAAILPYAPTRATKAIREKLGRDVKKIDPHGSIRRHQEQVERRSMDFCPDEDGMATLYIYGPAETLRPIFDITDRCARSAKANGATGHLGMLRMDALADLILGNQRQHVSTEIQVVVPASTLAGMSTVPGELHGYGAITNDVLHKLASQDVFWRRVVTDPLTGAVLDVGPRRRHTSAIGHHIRIRDERCVFPGCTRPAAACQIDHSDDYAKGGKTSVTNLGAMCGHHNLLKLEGGWSLRQPKPGYFVWTSPSGATFDVAPEPVVDPEHNE